MGQTKVIQSMTTKMSVTALALVCLSACAPMKFEAVPSLEKAKGDSPIVITPEPTPVKIPVNPPDVADTPDPTPTPAVPPVMTPVPTPVSTPVATPVPTPVSTPVATPVKTPSPTPVATPSPTPVATPVLTAMESFYQDDSANKVDILIFNDNSASMDQEQQKMSEKFSNFISAISDIDYQIAMTTTDVVGTRFSQGGRIMTWEGTSTKILTRNTPEADKAFKKTIKRSETVGCMYNNEYGCPSSEEQPLRGIQLAVDQRYGANKCFFRDKVDLVVIVLSDEDELSTGPAEATKPNEVINSVRAAFGNSKRFVTHGIIIKPGDKACRSAQRNQEWLGTSGDYGTHVAELASLTGGSTWSICDSDYGKNLSEISKQVRSLVGTFELHQTPKAGSVKVTLTPAANIGYRVEGKKVIFDTPPPAGTRVEISYAY